MKTESLANEIAHELNNLLTTMLISAHFVQMDISKNGLNKEDIAEIVKACERAKELTKKLVVREDLPGA